MACRSAIALLLSVAACCTSKDWGVGGAVPVPTQPYVAAAISVMVIQPSLGATLELAHEVLVGTGAATLVSLPVAALLTHQSTFVFEAALPLAVALLTTLLLLTCPPRSCTLAAAVSFLILAMPLRSPPVAEDTKVGLFGLKLCVTVWIGVALLIVPLVSSPLVAALLVRLEKVGIVSCAK